MYTHCHIHCHSTATLLLETDNVHVISCTLIVTYIVTALPPSCWRQTMYMSYHVHSLSHTLSQYCHPPAGDRQCTCHIMYTHCHIHCHSTATLLLETDNVHVISCTLIVTYIVTALPPSCWRQTMYMSYHVHSLSHTLSQYCHPPAGDRQCTCHIMYTHCHKHCHSTATLLLETDNVYITSCTHCHIHCHSTVPLLLYTSHHVHTLSQTLSQHCPSPAVHVTS